MKNPFAKNRRSDYENYEDYDSGFYRGDEDEEDGVVDDLVEDEQPKLPQKRPTQSAATGNMLKVVKPHNYDDGPVIAGYLMDGYTVVMNIEELERAAAMRLIDFLLGALEVLDGEFRRVTKTTLVLSPRSGEMTGEEDKEDY
ncbi:MAG: cell division protein SepF [Clostridia bacterium]|nr:cell division protein SepF [Clostridia bacterium]